ncbi:MAG TPA: OB-fold nucleic acid binding domain-containing protein [Anaeromyxobacteraceae bacterium]|jgi:hypothetical protein
MRSTLALATVLALAACKRPEPPASQKAAPGAQAQAQAAASPAGVVRGKVIEKVEAPPYSYLKLATPGGEAWAAVPQTNTAAGAEVTVVNAFPMKDFESKTLAKKFDVVYFGTLAGLGDAPAAPAPVAGGPAMGAPAMPPPTAGGAEPSPAVMAAQHQAAAQGPSDVKIAKVAKAAGPSGRTVEELFAQRVQLKDKSAAVKGQVVKFSPGIMGRNWIHLRDGTGSAEKSTNDLTVTTQDDVKVGDVVTARGTVRVDRDFGAGYAYPVIVEDAKVSK